MNLLCRGASLFEKGNIFDILALYSAQFLYFCVVTLLNHFNLIFKRLWNRSNTPVITFISHNGRKYQAMYRYVPVFFFFISLCPWVALTVTFIQIWLVFRSSYEIYSKSIDTEAVFSKTKILN